MAKSYIANYDPFSVGFDKTFDILTRFAEAPQASYPPYNIIKVDKEEYRIDIALAGFTKSDIQIQLVNQILKVSSKNVENVEDVRYLHRGIAKRSFTREFTLAPTVEVVGAEMINGILEIRLVNKVPDEKKPKLIEVN